MKISDFSDPSTGRPFKIGPSRYAFLPDPLPRDDFNPHWETASLLADLLLHSDRLRAPLEKWGSSPPIIPLRLRQGYQLTRLLDPASPDIGLDGHIAVAFDLPTAPPLTKEQLSYFRAVDRALGIIADGAGDDPPPVDLVLIDDIGKMLHAAATGSELPGSSFRDFPLHKGRHSHHPPFFFAPSPRDGLFTYLPGSELQVPLYALSKFLRRGSLSLPPLVAPPLALLQLYALAPFRSHNDLAALTIFGLLLTRAGIADPFPCLGGELSPHADEIDQAFRSAMLDGDHLGWVHLFFRMLIRSLADKAQLLNEIYDGKTMLISRISGTGADDTTSAVIDIAFSELFVAAKSLVQALRVSFRGAQYQLDKLVDEGILVEATGQKRNRRYAPPALLTLLDRHGGSGPVPGEGDGAAAMDFSPLRR